MAHDTMRRDGGFTVELVRSLNGPRGVVNEITIRPPTLEDSLKWSDQRISSVLGLLSHLSGQPERLLRALTWPDADRVMVALGMVLPDNSGMKNDFLKGTRNMATDDLDLPEEEMIPIPDQDDGRFPQADGPVQRFDKTPKVVMPKEVSTNPGDEIAEAIRREREAETGFADLGPPKDIVGLVGT
jgi:hypothetical protein